MARIRSIKPSIWGDERFASLSRDARLLTIGLISSADDAGRFIASPTAIAGAVYPHDELSPGTIRKWRDEIARSGLIRIYKVGSLEYAWFPNWRRHQVINRASPSVLPAPPGFGGDPGPLEPPPDHGDFSDSLPEPSLNGQGPTHGGLTTRRGVGEGREKNPPNPPASQGGRRCTKHRRPKDYCDDCHKPPLAPVPSWCGQCESDEHRWIELDDGRAAHCPRCHPSTVRSA